MRKYPDSYVYSTENRTIKVNITLQYKTPRGNGCCDLRYINKIEVD